MERSWWWKATLYGVLVVLACLYLVPTLVPEEKQPAVVKKYFQKRIQLGLDLQGGLHLVYEVNVDKAVAGKVTSPAPSKGSSPAKPASDTAGKSAETPAPADKNAGPHFDLSPPPPGQDLDSGLKAAETEVPTIKVEEAKPATPAKN